MPKLTKASKVERKSTARGLILYEGPSVLDGSPIVVIATMKTTNRKIGDMIQTWILRSDTNPVEASKLGLDQSICGNCPLRRHHGGACYVNLGQAPLSIYKAYKRGAYPKFEQKKHAEMFFGRKLRLGAYGDPAAVPYQVFEPLVDLAVMHTGYTHQIRHKNFDIRYLNICMVSADTPKQAIKYQNLGARTFRVAIANDNLADNEVECLADAKGISCADCGLCGGKSNQPNIAITVHGSLANHFHSPTTGI